MNNLKKLENKHRIKELNPIGTLNALGLKESKSLLDFGAGTGVFSFPASHMTTGNIYAVDINEDMIDLLNKRKHQGGVKNLVPTLINSLDLSLDSQSIDIILLATVFHEVDDKTTLVKEFSRILKEDGRVGVIEFHKDKTPMGPPIHKRLSIDEVNHYFSDSFKTVKYLSLGDNFYLVIYSKK